MPNLKVFMFIGKSGSGKGTQIEFLESKFKSYFHITTSSLITNSSGPFSKEAKKIVEDGGLVPSWFVIYLLTNELLKLSQSKKKFQAIFFEGSPRSLVEAQLLDQIIWSLFNIKPIPILIDVTDKEVKNRLLIRLVCKKCNKPVPPELLGANPKKCSYCGGPLEKRKDDNLSAINNRLKFFKDEVVPALVYYQMQKRLIIINGQGSVKEVSQRLLKSLKTKKIL
mgnify:CR=1 FL=1